MGESPVLLMQRALQLAALGQGHVAPNPMVGCVIHHPTQGIIGEGWHQKYGEAHAEVNAIHSVENQDLLKESTLYVTLEPCSHFGKTPPCADLIVEKKIQEVVVACLDPNPLVAGGGVEKLKAAGVNVETGLLEKEAKALNKKFFVTQLLKRPFITLKWAQTADGFVARPDGSSKWISSAESRMWVHRWRAEHEAILVGKGTLLKDDPQLTVRDWMGPNPVRIVLDRKGDLPKSLKVFDPEAETKVFTDLDAFIDSWQMGFPQSLFVEGGAVILQEFIDRGLWDEALVFQSADCWKEGLKGPVFHSYSVKSIRQIGSDCLHIFNP